MQHRIARTQPAISAEYRWMFDGARFRMAAAASGAPNYVAENSVENFITEHYWGYSGRAGGGSVEYRVAHERWRIWTAAEAQFEGDVADLYGPAFREILQRKPHSAFIAEGSPVVVHRGRRIA